MSAQRTVALKHSQPENVAKGQLILPSPCTFSGNFSHCWGSVVSPKTGSHLFPKKTLLAFYIFPMI